MLKRNQLYVSLFATSLVLASSVAIAVETVSSTASVTVQNAFDLSETTALSFGTIRATFVSTGTQATILLNPDGTRVPTNTASSSSMAVLVPGEPAEFAIANASSFTPMRISVTTPTVDLINAAAPTTTARFTLTAFTFADVLDPSDNAVTTVTTDVSGTASFLVGATLTSAEGLPDLASTTAYIDGAYEGNFTVRVEY
jgi:hypothetical protein